MGDIALIHGVAAGKALNLHDIHAKPAPGGQIGQKLLSLRALRKGFAGNDFLIDMTYGVPVVSGQGREHGTMAGEGFTFTSLLCLIVCS